MADAEAVVRSGRRPGKQDTRGQILAAAREAFAANGFSGTSIRGIARQAGVDAALVHHYFATKQQLFLATVEIPLPLGEMIDRVAAPGLAGLGERLVGTLLTAWDSELQPSLVAAARTALTDPSLTRSLQEFLSLEVVGRIVHRLDLGADSTLRAGLVASQMLGLIIGRYVLRFPWLADQPRDVLVAIVGPAVQRYLQDELPR